MSVSEPTPLLKSPELFIWQLILRLIDDYLFITTDHAKARRFLDVMIEG